MLREHDVTGFRWPDTLRVGDSGRQLQRIEDPMADRLVKGDPVLGWEGDSRLALYLDYAVPSWELWRLEADGIMRPTTRLSAHTWKGPDAVGEMIAQLIGRDQRRGVKVLDVVERAATKAEGEREATRAEAAVELADKLVHAFTADGVA